MEKRAVLSPRKRWDNATETYILEVRNKNKKYLNRLIWRYHWKRPMLDCRLLCHTRRREGQHFISVQNWLSQWMKSQ
jgi:hypothetical protein